MLLDVLDTLDALDALNVLDVIALVVAICAFLVSLVTPIFEFVWNYKMNKHNLMAEHFRTVYGEILFQEMPIALNYIHYDGHEVSGTEKLCDVLRTIRIRSIYFKVADKVFFDKLKGAVQNLEDYIIQSNEKMSLPDFLAFYETINNKVEIIYKYMNDLYIGEKVK